MTINDRQADIILKELKERMRGESEETRDLMLEARVVIMLWQREGAEGSVPHADDLRRWGIDLSESEIEELSESTDVVPEPPEAFTEEMVGEEYVAETPSSDPDDRWQNEYEDAMAALDDGEYYVAYNAFGELQKEVGGRLVEDVKNGLTDAGARLEQATQRMIKSAEKVEQEYPDNSRKQKTAWEAVLQVNEGSQKAAAVVNRLTQEIVENEIRSDMADVEKDAKKAANADLLPSLNELLWKVSEQRGRGEKDPPEISGELYEELRKLEKTIEDIRQNTRDRLGEASTLLVSGDYREAYRRALIYYERAVPTIIDERTNEERDTIDFFAETQKRFLSGLRDTANKCIAAAETFDANPAQALNELDKAIKELTDDVLAPEDKGALKPDLERVLQERDKVQRKKGDYDKAKIKIDQALQPSTLPAQKLAFFEQAREVYREYPDIRIRIDEAQDEVAKVAAVELGSAISQAQRDLNRDDFPTALTTLKKAREKVPTSFNPKPGSDLENQLTNLEHKKDEIIATENAYQQLQKVLVEVDDAFGSFRQSKDRTQLDVARNLLEQMAEGDKKRADVQKRWATLASLQGDEQNWINGTLAYRNREWQTAEQMLRKVVSSSVNADDAAILADRAKACQLANEALANERDKDWGGAIEKYRRAIVLFEKKGADDGALSVYQDCNAAIIRLGPIETADQMVRESLEKAEASYQKAQQNTLGHLSRDSKVEPILEFGEAIDILEPLRQQQTTLAAEVNALLQKIRRDWRKTYLEGMHIAKKSRDLVILGKGMALAKALDEKSLLYDDADEGLARTLKENWLDTEFNHLDRKKPTPWRELEENRKQRCELDFWQSNELAKQHKTAIQNRIIAEVRDKDNEGYTQEAREYLKEELRTKDLFKNKNLFKMAMRLSWKLGDWGGAEQLAEKLGGWSPKLGDVWKGMTRAARWFDSGFVALGKAGLEGLRSRYGDEPELVGLIKSIENDLIQDTLSDLAGKAQNAMEEKRNENYIEAARFYAQATELDSQDPRVTAGLQQLGKLLGPGIETLCSRADGLKVDTRSLADVVEEAKTIVDTLSAIYGVKDALGLTDETKSLIAVALGDLSPKLERWEKISVILVSVDIGCVEPQDTGGQDCLLKKALQNPKPLTGVDLRQGGWSFDEVRSHLDKALVAAQSDYASYGLVQAEREKLELLEVTGRDLTDLARSLRLALRDEEFDNIVAEANKLMSSWEDAKRQAPWGGLESLIEHTYPVIKRTIKTTDEHRKQAEELLINWRAWQRWSKQVSELYNRTNRTCNDLDSSHNSFDELRQNASLTTIKYTCEKCIKQCEYFDKEVRKKPEVYPLSNKAAGECRTVDEVIWREELHSYHAQAHAIYDKCTEELAKLPECLRRLRSQINQIKRIEQRNKPITADMIQTARNELTRCDRIDPLNEEIGRHRQYIESKSTS